MCVSDCVCACTSQAEYKCNILTLNNFAIAVCLTSLDYVIIGGVQLKAVRLVSVMSLTYLNVLQWNDSLWFFVLMEKNFQLCIHHTHIHIYTLDTYIYLIMLLLCRTIPIGWTEFCNIIEIYNYAMKFSCITNLCPFFYL